MKYATLALLAFILSGCNDRKDGLADWQIVKARDNEPTGSERDAADIEKRLLKLEESK